MKDIKSCCPNAPIERLGNITAPFMDFELCKGEYCVCCERIEGLLMCFAFSKPLVIKESK